MMAGGVFVLSRPVVSSVIGVCLGITLSVIFTPFLEDRCIQAMIRDRATAKRDLPQPQSHFDEQLKFVENAKNINPPSIAKNDDKVIENEFDPNSVVEDTYISVKDRPINKDNPKLIGIAPNSIYKGKPTRPRYASTELGIREKLYVAVLTSLDTIDTFAIAINRTLAHYVTKITFFVKSESRITRPGMNIVSVPTLQSLLALEVVNHVRINAPETYDYYYLVSDLTFTRGQRLFDFVSHISVSEDLYVGAGNPYSKGRNCGVDGGVLISQRVMSQTCVSVEWCLKNAQTNSASDNLGNCVTLATGLTCSPRLGPNIYTTYVYESQNFDTSLPTLSEDRTFNMALTVYPLPDGVTAYKLHRYFCQLEINVTLKEISDLKDNIVALSVYTPAGKEGLSWPIGVPASLKPKNRFDVIQWTYFTETHIYFETDFSNEKLLSGADKQDTQEIVRVSVAKINSDNGHHYKLHKLVNGYRRFDAQRGMEYILDLELEDTSGRIKETRIYAVRPLGPVEIVPLPLVTENIAINLVLPVVPEEYGIMGRFLDWYDKTCIQNNINTILTVVFVYRDNDKQRDDNHDTYSMAKTEIASYTRKYGERAEIYTKSLHVIGYVSEVYIMDSVVKDYHGPPIVGYCSPGMVLSKEYIGRLRLNVLPGAQVYFPMPFFQYKPEFIFNTPPYPLIIDIKRGFGLFDSNSYEHSGFYVADYVSARKGVNADNVNNMDLFQMFVNYRKFHVFRAVEPVLKHYYKSAPCQADMPSDFKTRCEKRRVEGLASKSRLAMFLFEQKNIK